MGSTYFHDRITAGGGVFVLDLFTDVCPTQELAFAWTIIDIVVTLSSVRVLRDRLKDSIEFNHFFEGISRQVRIKVSHTFNTTKAGKYLHGEQVVRGALCDDTKEAARLIIFKEFLSLLVVLD